MKFTKQAMSSTMYEFSHLSVAKLYFQSILFPHEVYWLIQPVKSLVGQFHIKMPDHPCHNRSQLIVCETKASSLALWLHRIFETLTSSQYNFLAQLKTGSVLPDYHSHTSRVG